jgi:hypothetical protein
MNTKGNNRVTASAEDSSTENRGAFGAQLFALSTESPAAATEESLAISVLSQAVHDLRRFHSATNGIERELYLGAYAWIKASDFSWPYSFVNVCQSLHVSPEIIRAELSADVSLGRFDHWISLGKRLSRWLRASFIRVFTRSRDANRPESGRLGRASEQPWNSKISSGPYQGSLATNASHLSKSVRLIGGRQIS